MRERKVTADFKVKWWYYFFIVPGFIQILTIQFWIIHLISILIDRKNEKTFSAKKEFLQTALLTGLVSFSFVSIMALIALIFG